MFTGIVEQSVSVIGVASSPGFFRITLANPWTDVKHGESVAINGCCLTIAEFSATELGFDVVTETLSKTNLGLLNAGDLVHVERSLRIGDRLDGHFVQGHVDGTGPLVDRTETDRELRLTIEAPPTFAQYLTPKGSVTVDGVSLTIAAMNGPRFEVALIPTTLALTQLGRREIGWPFNLEADILSKTIVTWLERRGLRAED